MISISLTIMVRFVFALFVCLFHIIFQVPVIFIISLDTIFIKVTSLRKSEKSNLSSNELQANRLKTCSNILKIGLKAKIL